MSTSWPTSSGPAVVSGLLSFPRARRPRPGRTAPRLRRVARRTRRRPGPGAGAVGRHPARLRPDLLGVANRQRLSCAATTVAPPSHGRARSMSAACISSGGWSHHSSDHAGVAWKVTAGTADTPLARLSPMKPNGSPGSCTPPGGGTAGRRRGRSAGRACGRSRSSQRGGQLDRGGDHQRERLRQGAGEDDGVGVDPRPVVEADRPARALLAGRGWRRRGSSSARRGRWRGAWRGRSSRP